jgi:hypothetical protein
MFGHVVAENARGVKRGVHYIAFEHFSTPSPNNIWKHLPKGNRDFSAPILSQEMGVGWYWHAKKAHEV